MDATLIKQALQPRPFRYFSTTGSTNADALQWLSEEPGLPSGAVVIANEQTLGRGRLGRTWLTPPGSAIAMSLILRDLPSPQKATMLGAVAVAEALEPYAPVTLKWSNDVQIDGKKVCGILADAIWIGTDLGVVVLGMGINITVDFQNTELADTAISLQTATSTPLDNIVLIRAVLDRIDYWLDSCRVSPYGYMPLFNAWKGRLNTLGKQITIYTGVKSISGKAVDVDQEGALIVETEPGKTERFLAGDVSLKPI